MAPLEILAELSRRGVELLPEGESLRYRAPTGALTPELKRAIADQKRELLDLLAAERGAAVRIYSRHLDAEVWIVADDEARLELTGEQIPVITAAEAMRLGRMHEAEARALITAATAALRTLGGSIAHVGEIGGFDA